MGIVRFALKFPHTFYVMALAILFLGISAAGHRAQGHLSRDQYSGRHGHLAVPEPDPAGGGPADHDL